MVQTRPYGHIGVVIDGGRPGRLAPAELRAAMAAPEPIDGFASHRYRVDGLDLHVRERPGGSPAYLLLHGLAVSHRYLMPTARCLPGRRVLVPDLPGFGLSGKPRRTYSVEDHSRVLAAWLDALAERGLCVIGNSFGCQVAVDLAVRRPDLVAAPARWLAEAAARTPTARTLTIPRAAHNAVTTAGAEVAQAAAADVRGQTG